MRRARWMSCLPAVMGLEKFRQRACRMRTRTGARGGDDLGCALGDGACALEAECATRGNWRLISHAVEVALEAVSLAEMAMPVTHTVRLEALRRHGTHQ